jgi:glutathione peroxidase
MHKIFFAFALGLTGVALMSAAPDVYGFKLNTIDGETTSLAEYKGKAILLVNVASKCGYTPQYEALEAMYKKYKDRGLVIVGVPANNFGGQEPGSNQEIKEFCSRTFHVTFPMMSKVSVKGQDEAPLYKFLTTGQANPAVAGDIKWNFTKFLVDRNGKVVARFESGVTPDANEITTAVEAALR